MSGVGADTTLLRWTRTAALKGVDSYGHAEDRKGWLSQGTNPFNQQFWREYDLDGKSTAYRFPSGSASPIREARSYTSRDWLANITIYAANGGTVDSFTYGYLDTLGRADPTGQIHTETDMVNRVHVFAYNKHRELVYESHPDFGTNSGPIAYSYDRNGNRLTRSVAGLCDFYGVDANNKLQWVNHNSNTAPTRGQTNPYMLFSYDANGNTTHRERQYGGLFRSFNLLWDGDDRLRQANEVSPNVGTTFTASYDGDGLRVQKVENWTGTTQTHNYTWGPGGVVYGSLNATTYTPGSAQRVSGTDRFSHPDWLRSTRYLSDSRRADRHDGGPSLLHRGAWPLRGGEAGDRHVHRDAGRSDAGDCTDRAAAALCSNAVHASMNRRWTRLGVLRACTEELGECLSRDAR